MCNLYSECVEESLKKQLEKIYEYFLLSSDSKKLQRVINSYLNALDYQQHRNNDPELTERVNKLFCALKDYIDNTHEEFLSSLSGNYVSKIFELVMG